MARHEEKKQRNALVELPPTDVVAAPLATEPTSTEAATPAAVDAAPVVEVVVDVEDGAPVDLATVVDPEPVPAESGSAAAESTSVPAEQALAVEPRRVLWAIFLDKMTRIARNQPAASAIAEESATRLWRVRGEDGGVYLKIENPTFQQPAAIPWHNISSVGFG